jgi:hypothetical protein
MQQHTLSNYKGPNNFINLSILYVHLLYMLQIICYWFYYARNLIANSSFAMKLEDLPKGIVMLEVIMLVT